MVSIDIIITTAMEEVSIAPVIIGISFSTVSVNLEINSCLFTQVEGSIFSRLVDSVSFYMLKVGIGLPNEF